MSELLVESRRQGPVTLIYPRGHVNAHTARLFEGAIQKAVQEGQFQIVISGRDLAYIASAGLGAIMGSIEEIRAGGGDLRLSDLSESVRHIFEILGFHHIYRIFPTESEALDSFGGEGRSS